MGIKLDGLDEFKAAFERLRDGAERKLDETLKDHMEHDVFPETQKRVPEMTGRLKGTGRVEKGDSGHEYSIWYGDSAVNNDTLVDYAAAVHERDARHEPPTGTKFVEGPLKESVPRLADKAAQALEDLARG